MGEGRAAIILQRVRVGAGGAVVGENRTAIVIRIACAAYASVPLIAQFTPIELTIKLLRTLTTPEPSKTTMPRPLPAMVLLMIGGSTEGYTDPGFIEGSGIPANGAVDDREGRAKGDNALPSLL
ncbi:MAG: hypothetical protein R3E79_51360 [Caldilineaceae bacterium]